VTDPTKQAQAATAKTAREIIAAHVEALGGYWTDSLASALRDDSGWSPNFVEVAKSYAALHTLLDAPEGGVERVCEAGESLWREVLELLNYANGKRDNITPRLEEILCDLTKKSNAHFDALAALRASPESVGGAGVSATPCNGSCDIALASRQVGPDGFVPGNARECAEAWEREASRRGDERRTFEVRWERAAEDASRFLRAFNEERDSAKALTAERDALKADLAAARAQLERATTVGRPPATPPAPAYAAADLTQIARMDRIEARVAAVEKTATPPVTEAPISERIGPYAVDEVRVHPDGVFMVTLVGELEAVRSAGARLFEQVWLVADSAAAERAVKAPQAEG
jgi:hypothetical protein